MNDTAYDEGVYATSICDMVDDMVKCITTGSKYVKMPVPINGIGPVKCIEFIDDINSYPADLNPRSNRSSGTSAVSTSIASRARFRVRDATIEETAEQDNDTITMDLDDAIKRYSNLSGSKENRSGENVSIRHTRSIRSNRSAKATNAIVHVVNNESDNESDNDEMEDVDEEPTIKNKPLKSNVSKASTSKKVEIKMGTPASRFRVV